MLMVVDHGPVAEDTHEGNRAYAAPAGGSGDALAHAIPISPGLLVQLTHPAERMRLAEP